jgi:hypothetical protein
MWSKAASRLGTDFFRKWGRGGRGPGASTGVPNPPPGPPRRLAAQNGKGGLCTALEVLRLAPAAATCAKASRQPVEGRGEHIKHVASHEISGPKSARPHGGIPSPGAEQ